MIGVGVDTASSGPRLARAERRRGRPVLVQVHDTGAAVEMQTRSR